MIVALCACLFVWPKGCHPAHAQKEGTRSRAVSTHGHQNPMFRSMLFGDLQRVSRSGVYLICSVLFWKRLEQIGTSRGYLLFQETRNANRNKGRKRGNRNKPEQKLR